MDPRFGPAWVAFGHTFALEGEHDHAVTAYSTCARMFTGRVDSQTFHIYTSNSKGMIGHTCHLCSLEWSISRCPIMF